MERYNLAPKIAVATVTLALCGCQAGGTVNPYLTLNALPPGVTIGCSFTAAGQVQQPKPEATK